MVSNLDGGELDRDQRDGAGKQTHEVQEAGSDVLGHEQSDVVVVPSDMLFIAALPGTHAVLEDFKLKHRGLDVLMAAAELEEQQVESIRRMARLLNAEFDDPEIDKRVNVDGSVAAINVGD